MKLSHTRTWRGTNSPELGTPLCLCGVGLSVARQLSFHMEAFSKSNVSITGVQDMGEESAVSPEVAGNRAHQNFGYNGAQEHNLGQAKITKSKAQQQKSLPENLYRSDVFETGGSCERGLAYLHNELIKPYIHSPVIVYILLRVHQVEQGFG